MSNTTAHKPKESKAKVVGFQEKMAKRPKKELKFSLGDVLADSDVQALFKFRQKLAK